MTDEAKSKNSLAKVEEKLTSSNIVEVVVNIFKAVLATLPFSGGIASLMTDYIPSSRFKRLEDFATKTAEDLRNHADEVNEEYLRTDDFAFMFEKCFRGAAENPQKEKLNAFRGIIVNYSI